PVACRSRNSAPSLLAPQPDAQRRLRTLGEVSNLPNSPSRPEEGIIGLSVTPGARAERPGCGLPLDSKMSITLDLDRPRPRGVDRRAAAPSAASRASERGMPWVLAAP